MTREQLEQKEQREKTMLNKKAHKLPNVSVVPRC
jgi:hypothetical protein